MIDTTPDDLTDAEKQLMQTEEELNAEIWKANAREVLNMAQSVYLVPDETDSLTIMQNGAPAIDLPEKYISMLLEVIREGVAADRIFIPQVGKDTTPERIKKRLEKGLESENVPKNIYIRPIPDGRKSVTDYANKEPGAFPAWIKNNDAVVDQEREQYATISGAGRLPALDAFIRESKPAISTGFPTLDKELGDGDVSGGLTAGLYTIGAISSLGKTTFAMQIADNVAAAGKDVLIIALEMSAFELMAKSISRLTTETKNEDSDRMTVQGILQGTRWKHYNDSKMGTICKAMSRYGEIAQRVFFIEGIGNIGVKEVRQAIIRHITMRGEAPVVVVDYLQILAPADPHATDKTNTDKAVLELKRMSRDFNTPIISISSFNRQNYKNPVSMEAMKESGAIEYSADVVIGLQLKGTGTENFDVNEAKSKIPREIEAVILKNRPGQLGKVVQFEYDPKYNLFRDVAAGHTYFSLPNLNTGSRNR